jgi:hypothetical protein
MNDDSTRHRLRAEESIANSLELIEVICEAVEQPLVGTGSNKGLMIQ